MRYVIPIRSCEIIVEQVVTNQRSHRSKSRIAGPKRKGHGRRAKKGVLQSENDADTGDYKMFSRSQFHILNLS